MDLINEKTVFGIFKDVEKSPKSKCLTQTYKKTSHSTWTLIFIDPLGLYQFADIRSLDFTRTIT